MVESLKVDDHKTKNLQVILKKMAVANSLLVPSLANKLIYRACSNIPKTKCLGADSLNVTDVLGYKNVLIDKEAVANIK